MNWALVSRSVKRVKLQTASHNSFSATATYKQNSCDTLYRNLINCDSLNLTLFIHDYIGNLCSTITITVCLILGFCHTTDNFSLSVVTDWQPPYSMMNDGRDDQVKTAVVRASSSHLFWDFEFPGWNSCFCRSCLTQKRKQIAISNQSRITSRSNHRTPSTGWALLLLKMSCLSGPELAHLVELLSDKSLESITLEVLCSR